MNRYDHPDILAGQGSMALEIIEQVPDVDAIIGKIRTLLYLKSN